MILKKINEFLHQDIYTNISDLEFEYLLSVDGEYVNINKDIFIFIGYNPYSDVKRIKISTNPNKRTDVFSIDIDRLVVIGDYDQSIITKEAINNLFRWIKINRDTIEELSTKSTDVSLLFDLVKIN
jgi:hypothetical protein